MLLQQYFSRFRQRLRRLLLQGSSPQQLAACISLGAVVSVCPIIGAPTPLLALMALVLRLNMPLIQAVNYLGTAPQWLLIVPFLRLGEWLVGGEPLPLAPAEIIEHLRQDALGFFGEFGFAAWHAAIGWIVVAVPAFFVFFVPLRATLGRAAHGVHARRASFRATRRSSRRRQTQRHADTPANGNPTSEPRIV